MERGDEEGHYIDFIHSFTFSPPPPPTPQSNSKSKPPYNTSTDRKTKTKNPHRSIPNSSLDLKCTTKTWTGLSTQIVFKLRWGGWEGGVRTRKRGWDGGWGGGGGGMCNMNNTCLAVTVAPPNVYQPYPPETRDSQRRGKDNLHVANSLVRHSCLTVSSCVRSDARTTTLSIASGFQGLNCQTPDRLRRGVGVGWVGGGIENGVCAGREAEIYMVS